jgi:predicted metalloprotease with PDZ domain
MHYSISYNYPHKHFIDVEIRIQNINKEQITLYLPAWRPGRYELQNYAKNIIKFTARDKTNKELTHFKNDRNSWTIKTLEIDSLIIKYSYFAKNLDAGGSWLDENVLYINPINCLMAVEGQEHEPCELLLNIPAEFKIACALCLKNQTLTSDSYYQLIDSPLLASKTLQTHSFLVQNTTFYIHIHGNVKPDFSKIELNFVKFITRQIEIFGEFPEQNYHFIIQILAYRHYHGVEHSASTSVVLGPDTEFAKPSFYKLLIGLCSHELFHAWNICKIRPIEMLPYNLKKENYFTTGFVVEGITTYYGDLTLLQSGVWSETDYLEELNDNLNKHFSNAAKNQVSLIESSQDLWVDGYHAGNPFRKVSIYDKGALVAFILDVELRKNTNHKYSLDSVMQLLWKDFGLTKKGYSYADFKEICVKLGGKQLEKYFENCIETPTPLEQIFAKSLDFIGYIIERKSSLKYSESLYGMKIEKKNEHFVITALAPGSPADKSLDVGDEITELNRIKVTENLDNELKDSQMAEFTILRNGVVIHRVVLRDGSSHFPIYKIIRTSKQSPSQVESFLKIYKINPV